MRRTLFLKFFLAFILFSVLGLAAVTFISSPLMYEQVKRNTARSFYEEASKISQTYGSELYNSEITIESAYNQLNALATYLSASIQIINPSGTVVLSTDEVLDTSNPVVIQNFDPAITEDSYYIVDRFFGTASEEMLSVFCPITSAYKIKGYVVIQRPLSTIVEESNRMMSVPYVTLGLLIILSLLFIFFFTGFVYAPLRKIILATEQYAAGNMHYEFTVKSDDEMSYLAGTLGYMAEQIARSEDTQKKFVANVSHDFRSPLTSIKGYLEAMLDGTIPPEMYEKYLTIVLNETERLTKLTNSLLQLNNLNTKGMTLEKSDFDMNQIIHNTAETFEGICQKKQIRIDLILTGEKMLVNGDMSKIQQVLYNLLDNAIKFSHHNSTITIETRVKHNKLFTSVKDTGIGIPKESLNLIFDRFYKTDLSRGKDKKGTGLGLSITKEIIHSHGENINVISTEGVGTEFIFTLPIVDDGELF
ncbi:MAG: HAMP domain-containing protein [Lachnospiraceae bacterium]|jgi:signal transduction histidine kinase|nr:HAMP domain-containing protein [Lachnospiraceae bacterium]